MSPFKILATESLSPDIDIELNITIKDKLFNTEAILSHDEAKKLYDYLKESFMNDFKEYVKAILSHKLDAEIGLGFITIIDHENNHNVVLDYDEARRLYALLGKVL